MWFLIGLIMGFGGAFLLFNVSSKKYREERQAIVSQYMSTIDKIKKDKDEALKKLEIAKKEIESLTAEQAKAKLSNKTQETINTSSSDAVTSAVDNIINRVKNTP